MEFPNDILSLRKQVENVIKPIKTINKVIHVDNDLRFFANRIKTSKKLPEYYLVFFLFTDILENTKLGAIEKSAWAFPIKYAEKILFIEYRKFGLGIFSQNPLTDVPIAELIVSKIDKAVKLCKKYYEYLANEQLKTSKINVTNNSSFLFGRFKYLLNQYNKFIGRKKKQINTERELSIFYNKDEKAMWWAISVVESFFSWTEHFFIHLAIVHGNIKTGHEIGILIKSEWKEKFKKAMNINDENIRYYYENLLLIRNQIRNCYAHGAFGKDGKAFSFHSGTGAVPIHIITDKNAIHFSIQENNDFEDKKAIQCIADFIQFCLKQQFKNEFILIHKSGLPSNINYGLDGTYFKAIENIENTKDFIKYQNYMWDNAANIDF